MIEQSLSVEDLARDLNHSGPCGGGRANNIRRAFANCRRALSRVKRKVLAKRSNQ